MPQFVVRAVSSQPLIELRGTDAAERPSRLLVCAGQLEVCADQGGGPARLEGVVRFLLPGAPRLPLAVNPSLACLSATAHPLGVAPIALTDARMLVVGARAALVADQGALTLALEIALEALYLSPPAAARIAWQVVATLPEG